MGTIVHPNIVINEHQLEQWAEIQPHESSKETHEAIREALEELPSHIEARFYLQGSYKNHTNIVGKSDVDIIIELQSTFEEDYSQLGELEQILKKSLRKKHSAAYLFEYFREDVIELLEKYFGEEYIDSTGAKCLKLQSHPKYNDADIVICQKYILHTELFKEEEGIRFPVPSENRWIINFPEQHYDNGCKKNNTENTNGQYKPVVRIFKNIKERLIEQRLIASEDVPSYFLECFLYNAPDDIFLEENYVDVCLNMIDWLVEVARDRSWDTFLCQNNIVPLFGETEERWNEVQFLQCLCFIIGFFAFNIGESEDVTCA